LRNVSDVFKVASGFFAARRILKRERPALLFSKGGFVSVPPCAAAASLKIPVFAHESDYSPGLATRLNSRFAEKIFIPYRESSFFYRGRLEGKAFVAGNPIRPEFAEADPAKGRAFLGLADDERILLVLGGSLGSREINELVCAALPELVKHYTVVHQRGEGGSSGTAGRYKPYAYFREEMPHVIAAAELVFCRSGANTIWECKYLNKPMILLPLRGSATRGDQVENARVFEEAGAAISLVSGSSGDVTPERFAALVASLAGDPERRRAMGEARIASEAGEPKEAARYIAEEMIRRINP
jgi:UDP-N-acetylglucosamine--N-acetylmuramyl-(pentapeptide) pyrophosphoryl-undecaprenol N-acetylglucosamine transferase